MKFTTALFALSFAAFASAAPAPATNAGAPGDAQVSCDQAHSSRGNYNGEFSQGCLELVDDCLKTLNTTHSGNIWGVSTCVSAAACDGTINLLTLAECQNSTIRDDGSAPSLDFNLYADIVGPCAWDQGGACPIDRQHFIDFVYGSLSSINTTAFPDVSLVTDNWWGAITGWTKTGETVPYLNFNDWLHWSHSQ